MPADSSPLAVLTLSWINEQMLLELDRRLEREIRPPSAFWRRQVQALSGLFLCGLQLLTLRSLA
jgi:hypothetical protein